MPDHTCLGKSALKKQKTLYKVLASSIIYNVHVNFYGLMEEKKDTHDAYMHHWLVKGYSVFNVA